MRHLIPLSILLFACGTEPASTDKDTDGTAETDPSVSETDDTTDTDGTSDTDEPADTDEAADTDETDVASATILSYSADASGAVFSDDFTADDVTLSCGEDGYGFAFRADFGSGSFIRMGITYVPQGEFPQSFQYVPGLGFLFRLPTGVSNANEDWGINGFCDITTTAPSGTDAAFTFAGTCGGDVVHRGGLDAGTITISGTLDPATCVPTASSMVSCNNQLPGPFECTDIPHQFCDDFAGCDAGQCEADPTGCATLDADEMACNNAPGCQYDTSNSQCVVTPLSDCEYGYDAASCAAEPTCAWNDNAGCTGETNCSELPEMDCIQRFGCTPAY